jgi:hypothetical protein
MPSGRGLPGGSPSALVQELFYEELAENLMSAALVRGSHDFVHRLYSDSVEQLGRVQRCY